MNVPNKYNIKADLLIGDTLQVLVVKHFCIHACAHTYTYKQTHTHTLTHTNTHAHTHAHTHTQAEEQLLQAAMAEAERPSALSDKDSMLPEEDAGDAPAGDPLGRCVCL